MIVFQGSKHMIRTGGRSDLVVQWFTQEFISRNKSIFKDITVCHGEILMVMKKGKVEEIVTEAKTKLVPGILTRLIQMVTGSPDTQAFMIDVKPKTLSIPFSGFSKDRTKIKGVVNMVIRFSERDSIRAMNLISYDSVTDDKWELEDRGNVKEITLEDLTKIVGNVTGVEIDSRVISAYDSSEINDNRIKIAQEIADTLNRAVPHWANYGIAVEHIQAEISENAYEEVMEYRSAVAKKNLIEDIDASDEEHSMDTRKNLEKVMIKNAAELKMQTVISELDISKAFTTGNIELEEIARGGKFHAETEELIHNIEQGQIQAEGLSKIQVTELSMKEKDDEYEISKLIKKNNAERDQWVKWKEEELAMEAKEHNVKAEALSKLADIRIKVDGAGTENKVTLIDAEGRNKNSAENVELKIKIAATDAYNEGYRAGMRDSKNDMLQFNESQARNIAAANRTTYVTPASMEQNQCAGCAENIRNGKSFCDRCGRRLM